MASSKGLLRDGRAVEMRVLLCVVRSGSLAFFLWIRARIFSQQTCVSKKHQRWLHILK